MNNTSPSDTTDKFPFLAIGLVILFVILVIVFVYLLFILGSTPALDYPAIPISYQFGEQVPWGATSNGTYAVDNASQFTDQMSCNTNPRTNYVSNANTCECNMPFFGPSCEYQAYMNNFKEIGPFNSSMWSVKTSKIYNTRNLSFLSENVPSTTDNQTCTQLCMLNKNCKGIIFQNTSPDGSGHCQILTELPAGVPNVDPSYNFQPNEPRMYTKNLANPIFTDRVFLYTGSLPWRYWLIANQSTVSFNLLRVFEYTVYSVNWKPTNLINDGNLILIVADQRFNPQNKPYGVQGINWVVIYPSDSLDTIPNWSTYFIAAYPNGAIPSNS